MDMDSVLRRNAARLPQCEHLTDTVALPGAMTTGSPPVECDRAFIDEASESWLADPNWTGCC